jgi:NAD+ kinase
MNDALATAPAGRLTPPRSIALIGKYHSPEIAESLRLLAKYLHEHGIAVLIEEETALNVDMPVDPRSWMSADFASIGAQADIAIVLGGDGTMLNAARQLARYRVPLVGVNQGRLGFMTDIARDDMLSCMNDLLAGSFVSENRSRMMKAVEKSSGIILCPFTMTGTLPCSPRPQISRVRL